MNVRMKCLMPVLLAVMFQSQPVHAQGCDAQLKPVENKAMQYRVRGNRCEGFYQSTVSAPYMDVVGVIDGKFRFESSADETLTISASLNKNQPIAVRAVGIPLKTYYRMDARLAPEQTFVWPVKDVLYPNKLSSKDIGIFGWMENGQEKLYVPVAALSTLNPPEQDGKIRLYLRSSVDVRSVQWRAADLVNGSCGEMSAYNKLPKSLYRTGEAIEIVLPASAAGALCVEVAAQDPNSSEWLKRLARVMVAK